MLDIQFEINGRRVDPSRIGDELESAMLKEVATYVKKTVGSTRCPVHGETGKITARGRSLDRLEFEVSGCCDDLIKRVSAKLK